MTGIFVAWSDHKDPPGWIEDGTGCHIWVGGRNGVGYGQVKVGGRKYYAHRARYEREVGPIPDGMELDHYVCNNGAGGCCNPAHVRPVTRRENALRSNSVAAINAAKSHCLAGHELLGSNLRATDLRRGRRVCRQCYNEKQKRDRLKLKEIADGK